MESNNQKQIKIICTIGPATESVDKIKGLADAGMSIARCNFSHGSHEEHGRKFAMVREVNEKFGKDIKIMLDTKGPDIRLRTFENGEVTVEDIEPSKLSYDEVQKGKINETLDKEKASIEEEDAKRRKDAYDESKPSLKEGAKATLISALLEGASNLVVAIAKKRKSGKHYVE